MDPNDDYDSYDEDNEDIRRGSDIDFHVNDIENEPLTEKSKAPDRRHISFHIVVNTNQRKDNMEQEAYNNLWEKLKNAANIFCTQKLSEYIILEQPKYSGIWEGKPLPERICGKPKVEYMREIGPKRGLIHLHISVHFIVRALLVRLDINGVKICFNKLLGSGLYIFYKTYRSAHDNIADYIRKTQFIEY